MKAIGVRVLKNKLSEYLRLVKAGETILVTDRDQVIAELRPSQHTLSDALTLDEALKSGALRNEVTLRSENPKTWRVCEPDFEVPPGLSSQEILDELRGEE